MSDIGIKQDRLLMFTDLTLARYEALKKAEAGTLAKMNGAMHEAMCNMIDQSFQITEFGRNVLITADKIMDGDGQLRSPLKVEDADLLRNTSIRQISKIFHANTRLSEKLSSSHMKLMVGLAIYPLQAYKYLAHIYGYSAVMDLTNMHLITGVGKPESWGGTQWANGWQTGVPFDLVFRESAIKKLLFCCNY